MNSQEQRDLFFLLFTVLVDVRCKQITGVLFTSLDICYKRLLDLDNDIPSTEILNVIFMLLSDINIPLCFINSWKSCFTNLHRRLAYIFLCAMLFECQTRKQAMK